MIQHHNGLADLQKLRTLRQAGLVHIHHDEHRVALRRLDGLLALQEHIRFILPVVLEHLNQRLHRCGDIVDDDLGSPIQGFRNPIDTDRGAEAVHISQLVSHDQNPVPAGDDFVQRMRLHPRLHAGVLFHLLALSAIIADLLRRLHHRLVSAAPQCHINGCPRKLKILGIGQAVQTDSYADGDSHLVSDVHGLHIVQNLETLFAHLRHSPLTQDRQILVLLQLSADAVEAGNVFVHLPVDQRDQKGTANLFHALQRLIIIIQIDQTDRKGLVIIFLQSDLQRRLIEQVHRKQTALILLIFNDIAVVRCLPQGNPGKLRRILTVIVGNLKLYDAFLLRRKPVPRYR